MPSWIHTGDGWHRQGHAWLNVNGKWPPIGNVWVNLNGVWRALHSYSWQVGGWGGCSVSCGGGVQYRTVTCLRNDGFAGGWDGYCITYIGAKPTTSQACNTHSCRTCAWTEGSPCGYYNASCTGIQGIITGAESIGGRYVFVLNGSGIGCGASSVVYNGRTYTAGTHTRTAICGEHGDIYRDYYQLCWT